MNKLDKYNIEFKSLQPGKHHFEFEIDDKFFDEFDYDEAQGGSLKVDVILNKMSESLFMDIDIKGNVLTICDRCLDQMLVPVEYKGALLVKIGKSENGTEINDEIMYAGYGENTINIAEYIYDSICLSMPIQRIHSDESQCNQKMIEKLKQIMVN